MTYPTEETEIIRRIGTVLGVKAQSIRELESLIMAKIRELKGKP
jgi:hypothetical protein